MTATLVASGLAGGHGHRTLFDSLNLTVAPGDVVGVVGSNGAGKSTLLRILAGVDAPQAGTVSLAPTDAFVGWLPQEHERVAGETIADYIGRRTGCAQATKDMDDAAAALGAPAESGDDGVDPADVYATALDRWLASGAADLNDRLPAVLADLGFELEGEQAEQVLMTSLSGGQAARVGLAALLLSRFDIVLLDEPTNDLDVQTLGSLENALLEFPGCAVVVSHDRWFLDRVATHILAYEGTEENPANWYWFEGNFESYQRNKVERLGEDAARPHRVTYRRLTRD